MSLTRLVTVLAICALPAVHAQQNQRPIFNPSLVVYQIPEEEPVNTSLGTPVEAIDPEGDPVRFLIPLNTINSERFTIDETTGELFIAMTLDREALAPTNDAIRLIVEVTDDMFHGVGVGNDQLDVRIQLSDINDNFPMFSDLPANIDVPEDMDLNSQLYDVNANDLDSGANALLQYYLYEVDGVNCQNSTDTECDMFTVEVSTGIVRLGTSLDYDLSTGGSLDHTVSVEARDRGNVPNSLVRDLRIFVQDVNDLNPEFLLGAYFMDVHENLTFGASVIQVAAQDGDRMIDDNMIYSIISGNDEINGTESFTIDNSTGLITVNTATLDRETHLNYILTVQAMEMNDPARFDTVQVTITVFDINDQTPFFQQSMYSANVSEDLALNGLVLTVIAEDRDHGTNAEFTFSMENAMNSSLPLPFRIEHNVASGEGHILVNETLDYETEQSYTFFVFATELVNGIPASGVTTVTVYIVNENDNNPEFVNASYEASIAENVNPGLFVEMVRARDGDLGVFGEVNYALLGTSPGADDFNITAESGRVETAIRLDYESRQEYSLQVLAFDLDPDMATRNTAQVTLTVSVVNINDNPPRFVGNETQPQVNIREELSPGSVYTFEVEDADGTLNPLTLQIVDGNDEGAFDISGFNLVTTRLLDFDSDTENQTFSLRVTVNDTESIDTITVDLYVQDINDNSPQFDNNTYMFSVYEGESPDTTVGIVFAEDIDSGSFGEVEYVLAGPGANNFVINETTGEIVTAVILDRESRPEVFDLTVFAIDQDSNLADRNQGSSRVLITTLDRNDNSPVFDETFYSFSVLENTDVLDPAVFVVRATDRDLGSNSDIEYSIVEGNVDFVFVIDAASGVIGRNTSVYLDHERLNRYTLTVNATDQGESPNSTPVQVNIDIEDENDVVPTFDQLQFEETVREDIDSGSIVVQLMARDGDDDENGQLTYSIISVTGPSGGADAPSGTFTIDDQGMVRTSGSFDREAFQGPYTVMVMVRDGGFPISHNSTTNLLVSISDANDNRPIFQADQYTSSLSENLPAGQLVATVLAEDIDMPGSNNSAVYYSISRVLVGGTINGLSTFSINVTSGRLTTNESLNYEAAQSYTITVEATDRGDPQRSSNAIVLLSVVDENDLPPEFSESLYTLDIPEDTPINTRFQVISATDGDTLPNAGIVYSSSLTSPFRIDTASGELILTSTLDFESITSYAFNVTATNDAGGVVFTDTSEVQITVIDVNDRSPLFQQADYSVDIDEGNYTDNSQVLGITLEAPDADSGQLGNVTFELLLPEQDSALWSVRTIANGRGQLVAIGNLDRETVSRYSVRVLARDGGSPAATATTVVAITVLDVNDITPQLNRDSYSATVPENSSPGDIIARVSAVDGDEGFNGEVILEIDDNVRFDIDPDTGEISTLESFNFETDQSFTVIITARDNATIGNQLSSTAILTVNVTDVNDNAPMFLTTPIVSPILENQMVGFAIATVAAQDDDSGTNAEIVYTLTGDEGRFTVDGNGSITIAMSLDRETTEEYSLTVRALDRGQPQMSAVLVIQVTVLDVNDVSPDFERDAYNFVVDEELSSGSTVGTVVAVDTDSLPNRITFMDIVDGDSSFFRVEATPNGFETVGTITNTQVLDYETRSSYTLRVRARNQAGGQESFTNVTISLRDLNDNLPEFSMSAYTFMVSESSPAATPVGTVVALDNDGGLNGRIEYLFGDNVDSNIRSLFNLGNESGILSLAALLDFEANSSYTFLVMARDMGLSPQSSTVSVTVEVQDTNENAPMFDQPSYMGSVNENEPVGSPVELVIPINATEQDGTSIEYSIVAGDAGRFEIVSVSGLLTTLQPLDRELQERYILTVQARDMGTTSLSSFTQVDITVGDINDNPPVFQEPLTFAVREDSPSDTLVGSVEATDRDAGTNGIITYSSLSSGPFSVRSNGDILVANAAAINFEDDQSFTVVVVATDGAPLASRMTATASVTITVTDINDNRPVFDMPSYTTTVQENSDVGVSVLTVTATDADGDTPIYSIVSGNLGSKFTLNAMSGLIQTTVNIIDREAPNEQQFVLQIEADDQRGRVTTVTVTINVMDVNDHSPICGMTPFMFNVPEDNDNIVRLGQLSASDLDAGENAQVQFSLFSGDLDQLFSVNDQGELFAGVGLDFESVDSYSLGVAVTDQSSDPSNRRTTICSVDVAVVDVNDNPPVFDESLYEATIIENATIGVTVTRVSADDLDSDINGEFSYSFQSPIREFSIDSDSGVVIVSGSLDADTQSMYTLVLEARDRGNPTRIGQTTLIVRVLDINDNDPRFDSSFFSEMIREDLAVNSDVVTLEADDPDSPVLTYSIESGNDDLYFRINPSTGLIQTARSLDRETVAVFTLGVAARDQDDNMGFTTLQIRITDVNDEAPQFLQSSYYARVSENSPSGTQVLPVLNGSTITIEAFDSDEPNTQNSRVLYSLQGPSADLFDIDFNTGIVTVAPGAVLDAESQSVITVTVVASDSVLAPNTRSSTVELMVEVLDLNDERPLFTQPFGYALLVSEGTTVPSIISDRVRADDPDGGSGGIVRYSITGANPLVAMDWFMIDPISGDLELIQGLDRERDEIITLTVTASDQGQPALMSVVTVQLTISDVNDNAPQFTQEVYTEQVPEFLRVGASALRVSASDPDVGSNADISFRVNPPNDRFTVNPSTGVVTSTGSLDHETQDRFTLTVEACDNGSPMMLCSAVLAVINVQDFNDEPPMFDLPLYTVDVCENATNGMELVMPVAVDRDSGTNADISYRLDGDQWSLFQISSSSGLVTLQRDVDTLDLNIGTFDLMVVATDAGDTPLTGTTVLRLRMINCTDTNFFFLQPYNYAEINEGDSIFNTPPGSQVEILTVGPSASNAILSPDYAENPFRLIINFATLKNEDELSAIGVGQGPGLDREVRDLYTIIIAATDNSVTSYASLTVRVLDINDNDPMFESGLYVFSTPENTTAPVVVGSVSASDRDLGVNGAVSYSVLPSVTTPHPFTIDNTTGVIYTSTELDRETVMLYNLTVVATDGMSRSGQAQVIISVTDINDCDPTFTSLLYTVPVLENIPSGTTVTTITAQDCDQGNNALLTYTIVGGDIGVFSLDSESGVIRTLTALDFEVVTSYSLTVRAVDRGAVPRTGEAQVNVEVQDFNDCPPMFINVPTSATIDEDQGSGSLIVTFEVSDCDSGLNGVNGTRFTIIAGNTEGRFSLNNESGVLVTVGTLDRETTANYLLSIQAQDSAGANSLSSITQLSINIGDVNDNAPAFDRAVITEILSENEDLNEPVFTFTATDVDDGLNSDVFYALEDGFGVFDVEETTGDISLVTTLDRETIPRYNLTVIARDRGTDPLTSTLLIMVEVRDVNDNAPDIRNITSGVTMATVIEGTVIGSQVFVVDTVDPDLNMNGEVSFSLQDLSADLPFEISPTGGVISVSGELDYEAQNEYTVVVIATDNGFPQRLSSVATLTINIEDSNDNNPEFTSATYEGSQVEDMDIGTSILTVLATDADQTGTPNAVVEYSLIDGDLDYFTIDPMSGEISNSIILDRENQSVFSLTVLANNSQSHTPRTGRATVQITVSDVNDERPLFSQQVYSVLLSELTATGTPVNITISATDNDAPETANSALVYSLARGQSHPFAIDPNTGELILLNSLDFETDPNYNLTLVVEDKGTPNTLSSEAQLVVSVRDENDVMPFFTQQSYSVQVSEGIDTFPYEVIQLDYNDGDTFTEFRQSTISVLATQPDSPGLFTVVTDQFIERGTLFLNREVDFELQQSYALTLSVENNAAGAGPLCQTSTSCTFSQTAIMEIEIVDVNDNSPVFTRDLYTGEVSSRASTGTSILSVQAIDNDAGSDSGDVRYSLQSSITLPFRVDENTGTVLTRGLLADIPSGSEFTLTVSARDNGGVDPANSDTTSVLIVVLDDFDRIAFDFTSDVSCVVTNERFFQEYLTNITGYTIVIESYLEYATEDSSLFIVHALDENQVIVDFAQFTERIRSREAEIFQLFGARCNLTRIISFAEAEEPYEYPPLVDTQTVVILVLCLLLIVGSAVLLVMALTQRYLALNNARHKLLADVFYGGSPGGGSVVDNMHQENYQLETLELTGKAVNRQNPMFVHPYDNWTGVDTSGVESVEGASSLNRDNPLYESQEIRMEMFADVHSEDEEADDAELLAQAIAEDESDDEDNAVTAI